MAIEHKFYDYTDAGGTNLIKDWLHGDGKAARARFINRVTQLSVSSPGGTEDSVWKPPFIKPLMVGKWRKYRDFIEIRVKENKRQYRLIAKKINREIFLVGWGFHDGKGWNTDITPSTAQDRVDQMVANPAKHRREHEI